MNLIVTSSDGTNIAQLAVEFFVDYVTRYCGECQRVVGQVGQDGSPEHRADQGKQEAQGKFYLFYILTCLQLKNDVLKVTTILMNVIDLPILYQV